jgi:hypothetical protein
MIVAEVTRNLNYVYLTNYAPFVYAGSTKYRKLKTEWGTSVDDLFETGTRIKVKQVTRDYLNKYLQEDTLAECLAQEGSFYFDRDNQLIYVHVEHEWSPLTAPFDYGYAFGVCAGSAGYIYIDDIGYEPVINDDIDISRDADAIGESQPTGSSSSLQMINEGRYNELTGLPEGVLDFMFEENLYHNDVFVYNYINNILTPTAAYFIEDWSVNLTDGTLNLQDKRFA